MNKLIVFTVLGIFLIAFVSAGIFDWLIKPKPIEKPYKPAFNISNDFTIKKTELKRNPIYEKLPREEKRKISLDNHFTIGTTFLPLNISSSEYFYENSEGIRRFKNAN